MPIDAKAAVRAAMEYLMDVYSQEQVADVLLEEIDTSKGGGSWLVTLSFYRPRDAVVKGTLADLVGSNISKRQYKVINVDKNDGTIHAMKMRAKVSPDDVERP